MEGIPGSTLTGPFSVGQYASALRDRLRGFTKVQVFGEVFGFKAGRAKVWFELRDVAGALPCSMWREDFDKLKLGPLVDGAQVVVAGGCDYYPGSRTASPSFSFSVTRLRVAGEGDLLAQLEQLRRKLDAEGLFAPQKALPRPALPKCIGVVTGQSGKARDDVLAGLKRRGWAGTLVWAFAPVQDRHAAPAVRRALQDLAACDEVEVIVVARGGGSLADLFAFCDETLCRTVALLRVPVISSVGHHTDRTLLDDVAAVACSTPTHAAETAVPIDCTHARKLLAATAKRLERQGRRAVLERARTLARLSRAPSHHVARHRTRLHQQLRELRAATRRAVTEGERVTLTRTRSLARKSAAATAAGERAARRAHGDAATLDRTAAAALERRRRDLERFASTLTAHDPQRTLERGYALIEAPDGEPITSAAAARAQPALTIRLHDGRVAARPATEDTPQALHDTTGAAPDEPPLATDAPHDTATAPRYAAGGARDEPPLATDPPHSTATTPRHVPGGTAAEPPLATDSTTDAPHSTATAPRDMAGDTPDEPPLATDSTTDAPHSTATAPRDMAGDTPDEPPLATDSTTGAPHSTATAPPDMAGDTAAEPPLAADATTDAPHSTSQAPRDVAGDAVDEPRLFG